MSTKPLVEGDFLLGPNHCSLAVDDEVKTFETNARSGGPNYIVARHPEFGEVIEDMQGPYLARQLSVF
jgi:hypothetical protein